MKLFTSKNLQILLVALLIGDVLFPFFFYEPREIYIVHGRWGTYYDRSRMFIACLALILVFVRPAWRSITVLIYLFVTVSLEFGLIGRIISLSMNDESIFKPLIKLIWFVFSAVGIIVYLTSMNKINKNITNC